VPQLLRDMNAAKVATSTACPSPGDFARAFLKADCSVCITISGQLSGTYNAAVLARSMVLEEHPEKQICIIDSKGAAGSLVLIARRALQLIEAGGAFEDISAALREYQASLRVVFTLSDFGNLIKNGRMNAFVGSVLTSLGIHVIADATPQGTIHVAKKAKGEAKTAKIITRMMDEAKNVTGVPVTISHCENLAGAMRLKQQILAELPVADVTLLSCRGLCSFYAMEKGLIVVC
ncbi:MAG: DegV family protein, partial [Oscillospiraceae bacterium]